jgi:hypothetical protein
VSVDIDVKTSVTPDPIGVENELITALYGPGWPGRKISLRDARELLDDLEAKVNDMIEDDDDSDDDPDSGTDTSSNSGPDCGDPAEGDPEMCERSSADSQILPVDDDGCVCDINDEMAVPIEFFLDEMTTFKGLFCSNSEFIVTELTRGARRVTSYCSDAESRRNGFQRFIRGFWPSIDDYMADDMKARAESEVTAVGQKVRSFVERLRSCDPETAFELLMKSRGYVAAAGLERRFATIIGMTAAIEQKRRRVQ